MKTTKIHILISCLFIFSVLSCNQKKEQKIKTMSITQTETKLDLLDLQTKNKLGKDTVVAIINDPVYHKAKKYKAVSASILIKNEIDLTKIDPKNTKIVFECKDGYKPEMPLELFLNAKPYLAFQDLDAPKGTKWEAIIKDGNEMNAAPFYIVYTSVSEKDTRYKWPYNLVKIHLEPLNKSTLELYPLKNRKLETGYTLFKNQCLTCHSINGIGGTMGPELNYPRSVTEYWKENELVDYIVNPASFRNKVKMPTLGITKQQSQEIVDYLKYMSENKKKI
ncbi:c-type cytochrome [Flavobacterium franklandianum]|uniref:C-type cytochrome n=1 Tax=Flavobacterium franklandianum TaxID=2594430 RepID=A0A553C6W1_9FLAO|nr:c-type cytochrome [Flavobacterium franklandianum]TRX16245.1 c-type cytochrome [Flavobacterium franklandianum]TRX25112.1 c-type cytochrome [Flavobacterium franklandianum]